MERQRIVPPLLLTLGLLFAASGAGAIGLATTMGKVFVNNVPVGSTVSIRDLTGMTYKVTNTGANPEEVQVAVESPRRDEGILSPGYEPIPDASWVWLSKDHFRLAPGQQGAADIMINIPKDKKHLEKKYQVSVWVHTVTKNLLAVGLKSRIMLSISPSLLTREEIKKSEELVAELDFHLNPSEIVLKDFPLGQKISAKRKYGKVIKLINLGDKAMKITLRPIGRILAGFGAIPGVEEGVGSLEPAAEEMLIEANSVGVIDFSVFIPKEPSYAGKKYLFILQAELQGHAVPVSAYSQIIVMTEKGEK